MRTGAVPRTPTSGNAILGRKSAWRRSRLVPTMDSLQERTCTPRAKNERQVRAVPLKSTAVCTTLENELGANLNGPVFAVQELDAPQTAAADISIRIAEVRRVHCVEQLQSGLQF